MIPNKSQAVPAVESGKIRNSTQQYAFMSDGYHEYRDIDGYRTYMNLLAIGDYSNIFYNGDNMAIHQQSDLGVSMRI